jgi:DNA-binding NtrC family response regulator
LNSDYDVQTVDTYQAAMEVIKKRGAELVIVDLRLSPTDEHDRQGMDLLQQLAEYRINSIVLTGYSEPGLKQEAEDKYEAFDFIDKSTLGRNLKYLKEIVQEAFERLGEIQEKKDQAIKAASALQSVSFTKDLSSWPLRRYRKKKKEK